MHILHSRLSADGQDFGTSNNAGVDEDDFACQNFAKAKASVDEPLVDDELHNFGPVRESVWEAGFAFFVFQLGVFLLQPGKPPDRHIRLHVDFPFPARDAMFLENNLRKKSGVDEERAKVMEWRMRWAVEAKGEEEETQSKSNGGRKSKGKTQDWSKARKASNCVSAVKKQRRRGRRAQMNRRRQEDWKRHKQVEEMLASSKGETRGVGRTRLAGKGKERKGQRR